MATSVSAPSRPRTIALVGNPNAGKTTLFNALTGLRQKVGNYPGVTVEKKEGRAKLSGEHEVVILDLPGTYSLAPKSPDEEVARDVLLGLRPDTPTPDAVLVVVDASNLERNLYLATQVLELGLPCVVALNMIDVARAAGREVDAKQLSEDLGCPVVSIIANKGENLDGLKSALSGEIPVPNPPVLELAPALTEARDRLTAALSNIPTERTSGPRGVALRLLCGNAPIERVRERFGAPAADLLEQLRASGIKPAQETAPRYRALGAVVLRATKEDNSNNKTLTDKFDAILTHRIWGIVIFALIVLLVFQSIYSFANLPMAWIEGLQGWAQGFLSDHMPEGPLRDLMVDGVIAGVGGVIVFLPQILILFFFIGILEDSGYMARAAFIMDKTMSRVGLHGRAFIPLLSSFACAIPGVMAARTISSRRDRMTTILIAPLMSCSARLPVYTLMIGTFIPEVKIGGFISSRALTMFSCYVLGVAVAMAAAWVFKKTLFQGPPPALMLELPPYKMPAPRNVIVTMWDRGSEFLKRAGTTIFALSIILWFALNYPKPSTQVLDALPNDEARTALIAQHSVAGRVGHAIEPLIAPIGFNWKVGIGLIGAMAAREVFVSTMGTVYSVGGDVDEESKPLRQQLHEDHWPDGRPVWTPLTAVSLLVYFVIAMQCISTLAVVKRETGGWGWPLFMQVYMTGLAWLASFIVYQGGRALGWGG
ncbi:ferrous iron transport protein B [bacterium]|nr:MAG: ferrous iron transport protein B [bacterium]